MSQIRLEICEQAVKIEAEKWWKLLNKIDES